MKKILLVDDMEISNFIMSFAIQSIHPGNCVYEFTDPVRAFSELDAISPDIIFLDLNMPEMDGWKFLDRMLAQKMDYTVYLLTSSTSELDKQRAGNYTQVADFLEKPLDEEELARILGQNPAEAV